MVGMSTVFVLGGAGITLGLLDTMLRSMGKAEIAVIINTIALMSIGFYTLTMVDQLFNMLKGTFL